jgi:hypothetical protein
MLTDRHRVDVGRLTPGATRDVFSILSNLPDALLHIDIGFVPSATPAPEAGLAPATAAPAPSPAGAPSPIAAARAADELREDSEVGVLVRPVARYPSEPEVAAPELQVDSVDV